MGMAKLRLLCAAVALLCAAPPGRPGAVLPAGEGDGYGVKLCGREFIRAVIFTCGGSRWKRLSLLAAEPAPAADQHFEEKEASPKSDLTESLNNIEISIDLIRGHQL
ncbi:hypothetical protein DUI87_04079 [Hirundo rustica rustica]|uniref:Insulin-like domain-containing protein n=1 Tax=Hirundo rustica rustica TaxID=333673 RepID=A0A3M0LK19_HIRRU|nr:hypothetical protein DUI87_04079 [Hirundo rustica rustica]